MTRIPHALAIGSLLFAATVATAGDPMEKMKMMDTDGNGMVSKAEHDAYGAQHFEMMDTNKDGSLSTAEFKAGMEMKKEMKKDGKKSGM